MHTYIRAFTILLILTASILSQVNPFFVSDKRNIDPLAHLAGDTVYTINGAWSSLNPIDSAYSGVNAYYWEPFDKIFLCGGVNDSAIASSSCYWFDPAANTYSPAASLPAGRWSGKLVRVRDELYLIGSINTFSAPDGLIYSYSPASNQWTIKDTMPAPFVHEAAVCVLKDSIIVAIGGSTAGFSSPRNFVRIYDPLTNVWTSSSSFFPINITCSHAEVYTAIPDTNLIYVVGGYSAGNLNTVYEGYVRYNDSISIDWILGGQAPFGIGVYRVSGAKWGDYLVFGPGLNGGIPISTMWAMTVDKDQIPQWYSFQPNAPDSIANISTIAVKSGVDSNYFYLFGGFSHNTIVNNARKYAFVTPDPIGIHQIGSFVPADFKLYQNYPNPFNPSTVIRFDVNIISTSPVELYIYDVLGRIIEYKSYIGLRPGSYEYSFDGTKLSSGIYFYVLRQGFSTFSRKMILLK
jgi:hypothetical protein